MNPLFKKLWHDPVWSKVIAGVILAGGATAATSYFRWWDAVGRFVAQLWGYVVSRTPTPNWLLAGLTLLAVPTLLLVGRACSSTSPRSALAAYRTDLFFGLRWRWRYGEGGLPFDLYSFCPSCDYQVYAEHRSLYSAVPQIVFHCDNCGRDVAQLQEPLESLESKIRRLIQQRIRSDAWRSPTGS
jgi:hypothetical protein